MTKKTLKTCKKAVNQRNFETKSNLDDESSKKQQHCAISYSYEPPASTSPSKKEESSSDEENEPFVPATDLKVPPDMIFVNFTKNYKEFKHF